MPDGRKARSRQPSSPIPKIGPRRLFTCNPPGRGGMDRGSIWNDALLHAIEAALR
jgi:hypothetical protein